MRDQAVLKAWLFSCNSLPAAKLGKNKSRIIKKKVLISKCLKSEELRINTTWDKHGRHMKSCFLLRQSLVGVYHIAHLGPTQYCFIFRIWKQIRQALFSFFSPEHQLTGTADTQSTCIQGQALEEDLIYVIVTVTYWFKFSLACDLGTIESDQRALKGVWIIWPNVFPSISVLFDSPKHQSNE